MIRFAPVLACLLMIGPMEAAAASLRPAAFDAGVQLSHITYREPGLMRESGVMYGVTASYTNLGRSVMGRIDGTLSYGEVDYVGAYQDGTPLTVKNIKDTMFEFRGVLGPTDFVYVNSYYLPYIGLGYRYLFDDANVGPGGYRRESNYLYIPIGVEGVPMTRGEWKFGFTLEYDLFLKGRQVSYLSDVDRGFNDVENDQNSGFGYRASVRFIRSGTRDIIIEPFYKYWKIDESDVQRLYYYGTPTVYGVSEPDNHSKEIGVRFIVRF